jgi:hypothetical protein
LLLDLVFECEQGFSPKALEIFPQGAETLRIQLINVPGTSGLLDDEAGDPQDSKVLRHCWPSNWEPFGKFAHRLGPSVKQAFQDCPPGGIAERIQLEFVSVH